ncbi:MAG: alpha-1,3-galactosidase B [Bacteroidales bacterium]|nr:alpha-1,3-galactosidase B [Bacteroidales bacterium]
MLNKLFALLLTLSIVSCQIKETTKIINVGDYGIKPNTKQSITAQINQLIDEIETSEANEGNEGNGQNTIIIFPKGRYDFYPDSNYLRPYYETNTYDINPKRLAVLFDSKKNITIDAQGSDFIFHGHIQPFTLDHSENIHIKNVNIDWDNPLTAEGRIIEADTDHILMSIDTVQFPYTVQKNGLTFAAEGWEANWRLTGGSWLIEIDQNHIIPPFTGDHGCVNGGLKNVKYSESSPGMVLMEGHFTKTPTVGNHLILRHSTRDHAGIFLFHSKNIKLQNINVYHTSGLGILSQYCENLEMRNVDMFPNLLKNRFLSGHDDGLHFMGCRGDIIIDRCDALGLMDDAINIHGTYVPVAEHINDSMIRCYYAHDMSSGLIWAKAGDIVGFVLKKDMNTRSSAVVKSFKQLDKDSFALTFKHSIPKAISVDYSLENLSCTPNVHITRCYVGSNRARGYLISTPGKVVIEDNTFETSGSAILIAGDANYWYESGAVKDIIIRNNVFKEACNSSSYQFCKAIISIYPEIPQADSLNPYHQNITIEGNSFHPSDYPIIYANSVEGLQFINNTIKRSKAYTPWHSNKNSFLFEACQQVEISGNEIGKDVLGLNVLLKRMRIEELNINNTELKVSVNQKIQR